MVNTQKNAELNSATSVVAILFTGAFILDDMGVTPFLDRLFAVISGSSSPEYFAYAIGSIGAFAVFYHIGYILLIRPIECTRGEKFELVEEVNPQAVAPTDAVNFTLILFAYTYLLAINGILDGFNFASGFLIIFAGMSFTIVPRTVARFTDTDWCYYGVLVVAVSIPICLAVFLPVIFVLSAF